MLFKNITKTDLYRYYGRSDFWVFLKAFINVPGFRYTYYLRQCMRFKNSSFLGRVFYFINLLTLRHLRYKFGFEISERTKIGYGFYLGHFGGVVINERTVIGNNVSIAQGVTIGKTQRGELAGTPIIGDRVWIGPHAVVVGGITIGSDVLLGPGAYVNFNVPDRSVVIGNPGKIVSQNGSDQYVTNLWIEDKKV